jgi:RNA polymerase sigma-70 factor (ECF subfamily)
LEENEVIRRAQAGDWAAWEPVVREHQEAVFRLAYLILGERFEPEEAEDIAQETFIRAYRALARFDHTRPLRPWLLSIAANLARNRRRSAGRYLSALSRLLHADSLSTASLEEHAAQRLEAQSLWQAVQRLDPEAQQVIYLRFFLDLPVNETAETLGVASGTIKSRLHRALGKLRAVIELEFPELNQARLFEE